MDSASSTTNPSFEEDPPRTTEMDGMDALTLNLDGFDGPIDLLLTMARDQKVDLRQISILALAEQYLGFVERARSLRIELAADYLVMAAWLAYLKSKLLLPVAPNEDEDELTGEALAEALAFQLQRLEAMRKAAAALFERPRLGSRRLATRIMDAPDGPQLKIQWQAGLYEMLDAYGAITRRNNPKEYEIKTWPLMSMEDASARLAKMLGHMPQNQWRHLWKSLDAFLPDRTDAPLNTRSAMAATLLSALEMVKQERAAIQQDSLFAPIYIKPRAHADAHTHNPANDS